MDTRTAADCLRSRVDEICATGNDDLAAQAWHALSKVLAQYVQRTLKRGDVPVIQRTTPDDVNSFLQELIEARNR